MRRICMLTMAIALLAPMAVLTAGSAGAATVVQCTKEVGAVNLKTQIDTSTESGCTPVSATGGSGKTVVKITAKASTTVWSGGKGTSVVTTISEKAGPKVNKCPKGDTLLLIVGKITGGTGAALKAMPKGQAVTTDVCVGKNDNSSLEPGTVAKY